MSRVIVGRIFWKELRALTSLWLSVAVFAVALEVVIAVWFTYSRPWWVPAKVTTAVAGTLLVAYVTVILYAIATASAAFTSELEGTAGTLFRTVPITRLEAFAGKWSYGLVSAAALFATLVFVALAVGALVGQETHGVAASQRVAQIASIVGQPPTVLAVLWMAVLLPIEFFALCSLFSLLFSDVLLAAAFGSFASVLASCGWWIGPAWINTIFVTAVISADFWLTGIWLQRGPLALWDSVGFRLSWPPLSRWMRAWQPAASWQRAAHALLWKEARQAIPIAAVALLAVIATGFHTAFFPGVNNPAPWTMLFRWTVHWIAPLSIPFAMGLAASHVDQKGRFLRFLGDFGVAPAGSWIVKQVVWLGLTSVVCVCLFTLDHWAARWSFDGFARWTPHRDFPESLVNELNQWLSSRARAGTRLPALPVEASTILSTIVLYALVAYSVGQFFGFLMPKAMLAMGAGIGATCLICAGWAVLHRLAIPITATVGVIPLVLLTFTLSRWGEWQTGRSVRPGAGWILVPVAAVSMGIVLYRMEEVPPLPSAAKSVPPLIAPFAASGDNARTLWLRAAEACAFNANKKNDGRSKANAASPAADPGEWSGLSPREKSWVDESGNAIAFALDAAKRSPYGFQDRARPGVQMTIENWLKLARLLWLSARERESAGHLDDAFLRYRACTHLAVCLSRRYETWFEGRKIVDEKLTRMRAWAAHPKQVSAQVRKALVTLQNLLSQTQRLSDALQAEWEDWLVANSSLAEGSPAATVFRSAASAQPASGPIANPFFYWETVRDRRIVNAMFATMFAGIDAVEHEFGRYDGWVSPQGSEMANFEARSLDVLRLLSTTPSMSGQRFLVAQDTLLAVVNSEAKLRMNMACVALASFRREHGRDPATLNELAPAFSLNLSDPWTGREFFYMPSGGMRMTLNGSVWGKALEIPRSTAFLMSEGFSQVQPVERVDDRLYIQPGRALPLMTRGSESHSALFVLLNHQNDRANLLKKKQMSEVRL